MSLSIPGVVCFDYGEVISHPQSAHDTAALLGVAGVASADADRFWDAYWRLRPELDQGRTTTDEYWTRMAVELGHEWDLAARQRIWTVDFRSWISSDTGVVTLMEALRDGGTRLALLSNAGHDMAASFRHGPISTLFERVFISAELDLLKPDPAIYERVCAELGIELAEFTFIDNRAENVEVVIALGGRGHVFTGPDPLREFLEQLASGEPPASAGSDGINDATSAGRWADA